MKNSLAKVQPIDPEFAACYGELHRESEPSATSAHPPSQTAKPEEDSLQAATRMLRERQAADTVDRTKLQGFDLVEHDVSTISKLAWDYFTRD